MPQWLSVLGLIFFAIGVTLAFVGMLFALLTAFGRRKWFWGIGMVMFSPLAIIYVVMDWPHTRYPAKLLFSGLGLLLLIFIAAFIKTHT